ncbi:MAG TPA: hypothetical protein VF691_14820 [Cytophagaceae bacterium]|jgi:hypothetical protein
MKNINLHIALSAAAIVLTLSACKKDKVDWYAPVGPPLNSNVKFLNALPNSSLDYYAYFTKVKSGVKYGDSTVPYEKTAFGNIVLYATNKNQTSYRAIAPTGAANSEVNGQGLVADFYQTVLACKTYYNGKSRGSTEKNNYKEESLILLRDKIEPSLTANIRFVHLAYDSSSTSNKDSIVNFNITNGPDGPAALFQKVVYKTASNSVLIGSKGLDTPGLGPFTSGPFTSVKPGEYSFDVTQSTTSLSILKSPKTVTLKVGKYYTVYSCGIIGNDLVVPRLVVVLHN